MNFLFLPLSLVLVLSSYSFAATAETIVVTCATGELGGAISKKLAKEHNLILTGRDSQKLLQLQEELKSARPDGEYDSCVVDFTKSATILDLQKKISDKKTSISGFVLITPRPQGGKNLLQEESDWLQMLQATFTGPIEALKAALPQFSSHAKIVIVSGITSVQLLPEYGPTCVVRRMWTTYAKALSHQLGPQGIHVNVLSPGVVLTEFHEQRITKSALESGVSFNDQMVKESQSIPLRRLISTDEVAKVAKFLLSKESDSITGVNLVLDGGVTTSYQ
jgi:3-oxoacyl-[acyl-carrier protein] reductase